MKFDTRRLFGGTPSDFYIALQIIMDCVIDLIHIYIFSPVIYHNSEIITKIICFYGFYSHYIRIIVVAFHHPNDRSFENCCNTYSVAFIRYSRTVKKSRGKKRWYSPEIFWLFAQFYKLSDALIP